MSTWDVIVSEAQKFGIPLDILSPIIYQESRGQADPAHNNPARGLLQLLPGSGQGGTHSEAELVDPRQNLEIGLPFIRSAYQRGVQLGYSGQNLLDYTASHSGHASQTPLSDTSVQGGDPASYLAAINEWFNQPGHGVGMLQSASSGGSGSTPVLGGIEHYGGQLGNAMGSLPNPADPFALPGFGAGLLGKGLGITGLGSALSGGLQDVGKHLLPYLVIGGAMLIVFIKLVGELGGGDTAKGVAMAAVKSPVK